MLRLIALCLSLLLSLTALATAGNVEFNYNGRVRSGGTPFNGTGQFKFAIVSNNGNLRHWSNDGVTLTNTEPTTFIPLTVSNGFFDVIIGDPSIAGMAPLDAAIFNGNGRLRLRVWFNDGVNGFQLLSPDRRISNANLIGLESDVPSTIYVNASTGDDANAGTTTNTAKKTIQAAWNAVPSLVTQNTTIQLAPGEYYGSAVLTGKLVKGDVRVILRGDEVNSTSVRVIGAANRATSTTASVDHIITVINQDNVRFTGLYFDRSVAASLHILQNAFAEVAKSQFWNVYQGVLLQNQSRLDLQNTLMSDTVSGPIMRYCVIIENLSSAELRNNRFLHVKADSGEGVAVTSNAHMLMGNTVIDGFLIGVHAQYLSFFTFRLGGNTIRNCTIGTRGEASALIQVGSQAQGAVTYQSCPTTLDLIFGSQNVG